jgi:hypothetical protein
MTVLAIIVLGRLEVEFVQRGGTTLPIHVLFTLLFVPAAFICAFVIGAALGLALGDGRWAAGPAGHPWRAGRGVAFLTLNVLQDLLGRRVGGPNAAATATMITVTLVCMASRPSQNGVDATRRVLKEQPQVGVIMLTMLEDDASVFAAMRAGARGWVALIYFFFLRGARSMKRAKFCGSLASITCSASASSMG